MSELLAKLELKTPGELLDEIVRLRTALKLFVAQDETMEDILWGNEPDDAMIKITVPLGKYRAARQTLARTADRALRSDGERG